MRILQPGTSVLARGRRWHVLARVPYQDCESIRLIAAEASPAKTRTLLLPFDRIEPVVRGLSPVVVGRRRWTRDVARIVAAARPYGSLACAADARIDLLPFQLEPALAMRRHPRTRVLVADDVGLGKTIQAGLLLAELVTEREGTRGLVLAPAGLRDQWRQELDARFGLSCVLADAAWLASATRQLPPDVNPWGLPGVHVTSFDLVKRPEVLRSLQEVSWDIVVVDEAHACTLQTARRAAAHALASRARRVLLLTATPPDGDPPQLGALRSIGELPGDPPLVEFRRSRLDVRPDNLERRSSLHNVRLCAAERRMHRMLDRYTALVWNEASARGDHRARLAALVLRKRALSSAWSLDASLLRRMQLLTASAGVDAGPLQLALPLLDEDMVDDEAPDGVMGAAGLADASRERVLLRRVRHAAAQACRAESKLRFLLRLIRRAREPVIVFTEYRDTLEQLERALLAAGHAPLVLHGGMGPGERVEVQRTFNESDRILLATDAASEGLNLHHRCRAVVHFELPWTLSRLRQRTGRVDRLGQRRRVHEILLVARHTAERVVLEPLVRRAHLTQRADRRTDSLIDRLTELEIAAAVMEGSAIVPPREPTGPHDSFDLREEAAREAARIAFERSVRGRCGSSAEAPDRTLIQRSRRPPAHFELLIAARLEDSDGRVVHVSLAAAAVYCRLHRPLLANADWRSLAEQLSAEHRNEWQSPVLGALRGEMEMATAQHRALCQVLAARDTAILEQHTPVARQLVQVSLFDRRAINAMDRQRTAATLLAEEHAVRARDTATPLRTTVVPVALR